MSPYALELASARLDALRTLIDALNEADTPDEKRRCAVAIFNAPDPRDLDDEIELEDDQDVADKEESEDDSDLDENSEEDKDSEGEEGAPNHAPQRRSAPTSDIAHPTSHIPPHLQHPTSAIPLTISYTPPCPPPSPHPPSSSSSATDGAKIPIPPTTPSTP